MTSKPTVEVRLNGNSRPTTSLQAKFVSLINWAVARNVAPTSIDRCVNPRDHGDAECFADFPHDSNHRHGHRYWTLVPLSTPTGKVNDPRATRPASWGSPKFQANPVI